MSVFSKATSSSSGALDHRTVVQESSSLVHRSQTVPAQRTGKNQDDTKAASSKVASRSQTMPILAESTVAETATPKSEALFQTATTAPEDRTYSKESDSQPQEHQTSLLPVRRSSEESKPVAAFKPKINGTHSRRVFIVWSICCFTFLIVVPLICIVLGVTLHTPDLSYLPSVLPGSNESFSGRTLGLSLGLVSADPLQSVVTFDWAIVGEDSSPCSSANLSACTDVNIFVDSNLLAGGTNSQHSSDVPTTPLFRLNATSNALNDPRSSSPVFRTDFLAVSRSGTQSSLINYPFDSYVAQIFMFAEDTKNKPVGLTIVQSQGNAVGFSTTVLDCAAELHIPPEMICILVTIKRGALVRAFCVIVTIAIWLITLILLLLTFTSIIFGFRQRADVLIVPVATIFAFTQLRTSMPGAPAGFGDILDFVGLLPCLAILAFSAALSLGAFILTDPTQKPEILTWDRLRRELLLHSNAPPAQATAEKEIGEEESGYSNRA